SLLVNGTVVPFPWMFFQLPAIIVCLTFVITGIFDGAVNVVQQRLILDLIPDRTRNSLYSLFPTLTLIFAAPQLIFFSSLLPVVGPSPILIGLSLVSTSGCMFIALGMHYRPKSKEPEKRSIKDSAKEVKEPSEPQKEGAQENSIELPDEIPPKRAEETHEEV
ncbi:MAG: hypothetical protein ACFFBR_09350, partial [Promethearchaeota archaeon]